MKLINYIQNCVKLISSLCYINEVYGIQLSDAKTKLKYRAFKTLLF